MENTTVRTEWIRAIVVFPLFIKILLVFGWLMFGIVGCMQFTKFNYHALGWGTQLNPWYSHNPMTKFEQRFSISATSKNTFQSNDTTPDDDWYQDVSLQFIEYRTITMQCVTHLYDIEMTTDNTNKQQ